MSTNRQAETSASPWRAPLLFAVVILLIVLEGTVSNAMFSGSWNSALSILNMGLISAVQPDMAAGIEAARLLTYKAAYMIDSGVRNTYFASAAKLFASDHANKCATEAVQIFGGAGFNEDMPVAKLFRDAKIFQLYEGTSEIQKLIISREIFAAPSITTPFA